MNAIPSLLARRLSAVSLIILLGAVMLVPAATVPMLDGIGTADLRDDFSGTVGFELKTGASDIEVSALGFIDPQGLGLLGTHQVGIWLPNRPQPLAQVTVDPATAILIGLYWYNNLDQSVVLAPNTVYWLGAEVFNGGDYWMNAGTNLANNPGFTQPTFAGFTFDANPATAAGIFRGGDFGMPTARQGGTLDVIFAAPNLLGAIPAVPILPRLLSQPLGALRLAGDSVTFDVTALGSSPLSYQWRNNNTALAGATNSSLSLTNLQITDAGNYTVVVSNPAGSVTSLEAQLTITNPPVDIVSGLVMHLTLDDGHGLTAADATANHHDGALQGFPDENAPWVPGRINGAVNFDATVPGEVILVPDDGTLDFSQGLNFSLACWVNGTNTQMEGAGILTKGTGGGGEQYALDTLGNHYRFYGWVGDGSYYLITAPVGPNGTWQHLAMVFSKTLNRLKFFVNGNEAGSSTLPSAIIASTHDISIGSRQSASADYDFNFNGKIDDVRIYNRALTPQDVGALYGLATLVPPTIVQQPRGGDYYPTESIPLTVAVDGSEPLTYQWQKDGKDIPGATQSTLWLENLSSAQAGSYQVAVSNARGNALSQVAMISVKPAGAGRIFYNINATGNRDEFTGTVGNQWQVGSAPLTVTALGFEDQNGDGLNNPHQVGLWDASGALLASVTVPAGTNAPLKGVWRYVTLNTPVVLAAGSNYWIGGQVVSQDGDGWSDSFNSSSGPVGITGFGTITMATYSLESFAEPTTDGGGFTPLRWAPANAQFTVAVPSTPPTLQIISSAGKISLSWSPEVNGWTLESTSKLPGTSWTPVSGITNNSISLTPNAGQSFYRLRR